MKEIVSKRKRYEEKIRKQAYLTCKKALLKQARSIAPTA